MNSTVSRMNSKPPPLPSRPPRSSLSRRNKLLIGLALFSPVVFGVLIVLRIFGLICPYSVPTGSMSPAVSAGDHVMMEDFTYLFRQPRRGDIVVFKSEGVDLLSPHTRYIKRVAGEPGERVRLANDHLFISDKLMVLSNDFGEISYGMPPVPAVFLPPVQTNVTVPDGCYFLIGDRATNSLDSRYFGAVPRQNITGRIWFCYWPPNRMGLVK
jgi:signal peptidase I